MNKPFARHCTHAPQNPIITNGHTIEKSKIGHCTCTRGHLNQIGILHALN